MIFNTDAIKITKPREQKTVRSPIVKPRQNAQESAGRIRVPKIRLTAPAKKLKLLSKELSLKETQLDARTILAMIYWCNGAKYPSSNFVAFSNSDPNLIKTFLWLFRRAFAIEEKKIKVHLQLYTTHDIKKVISFWSGLLNIPSRQFYNPTIVRPPKFHRRKNYFGTCAVRYYDLKLLLKIMDIYKGVANGRTLP